MGTYLPKAILFANAILSVWYMVFFNKKIFWQTEAALFFGSVARPGPARKFYFEARPDPKILMKTRLDPTRDFCSPTQPEPDKMPARHIPSLNKVVTRKLNPKRTKLILQCFQILLALLSLMKCCGPGVVYRDLYGHLLVT